jgi:hypothetical protein
VREAASELLNGLLDGKISDSKARTANSLLRTYLSTIEIEADIRKAELLAPAVIDVGGDGGDSVDKHGVDWDDLSDDQKLTAGGNR